MKILRILEIYKLPFGQSETENLVASVYFLVAQGWSS